MRFTPDNFLYTVKQLVTGVNGDDTPVGANGATVNLSSAQSADGGIKVDKWVPLDVLVGGPTLPPITDSTGGTAATTFAAITAGASYAQADMVAVKNALAEIALILNAQQKQVSAVQVIQVAASGTTIGTFSLPVPRDYDEASDHFTVRLAASLANADAGVTVTGTPTIQPIATGTPATGSAVTATAPFSTVALNATTTEQVFDVNLAGNSLKRDDVISIALAFAGTLTGAGNVFWVEYTYDSTIVSYNETDATQNATGTLVGFGNPLR